MERHAWLLLVPNGVDVREFSLSAHTIIDELPASVLFTGPLHYSPNTEAMLYFGTEIWPLIVQQVPHAHSPLSAPILHGKSSSLQNFRGSHSQASCLMFGRTWHALKWSSLLCGSVGAHG